MKKTLKNIISIVLTAGILISISACGNTTNTEGLNKKTNKQPAITAEPKQNTSKTNSSDSNTYSIGETWTVEGQWEFTINSVTEVDERNDSSDENPAAVYVINYTYTNLGYEKFDGNLTMSILGKSVVDCEGYLGYRYYTSSDEIENSIVAIGETCNAQDSFGVDHAGNFKIHISQYDNASKEQKATFDITV